MSKTACVCLLATLVGAGALSVGSTQAETAPVKVHLISAETRKDGYMTLDKTIKKEDKKINALDSAFTNIYPDVKPKNNRWHGLVTKVEMVQEWLKKQPLEDIVVFVDSDTLWGGCSKDQFLREFDEITKASGAKLVVGAEIGCVQALSRKHGYHCNVPKSKLPQFEHQDGVDAKYPEVPQWAKSLYDLKADRFVEYADSECHSYDKGACESPPQARFLNSGFIAGKVEDLLKAYEFVMSTVPTHPKYYRQYNDMYAFNHYFYDELANNGAKAAITLDYGNKLVVNLHGFQNGTKPLLEVRDGVVHNKLTGQTQCFIHGNGHSKQMWDELHDNLMKVRKASKWD